MKRSESIEKLAEALAAAQGLITAAAKDSLNPHFGKTYADLASVWDACRIPLTSNGLSVVQTPGFGDGNLILETTLLHTSGQWISSELPIQCDTRNLQHVGSALTYARRYSLSAMVGVCPDDDDAEAAVQPQRDQRNSRQPQRPGGDRGPSRDRQRPDSSVKARPEPTPAPVADEWSGYVADRASEAQARWVKAMEEARVDDSRRVHPDFQMPSPHEVNNHFVSHALKSGAIQQDAIAKDGKPGVRDPGKSKAALADLYHRAPGKVRQRVEAYLLEKEQALRVRLGMDDLDPDMDAVPATAGREPGSDDDA